MSARETHGNSASSSPSVFAKWQNFLRVGAWNHSWVQLWTSHEDAASENMVVVCFNIFNPFQGDEYTSLIESCNVYSCIKKNGENQMEI